MTMPWTDEERLRDDERSNEQRLRRINAAVAKMAADRAEAERVNRDGFYMFGPDERQEREANARQTCLATLAEERDELDTAIGRVQQQIADNLSQQHRRLVGASATDLARERELREVVRREVPSSTVAEIEAQVGAALRGGDRVLAAIWGQEIGAHVDEVDDQNTRRRLVELAATLQQQTLDPDVLKSDKAFKRRLAALEKHRVEIAAAAHPTHVALNQQKLVASGEYAPL